MSRRMFDQEVAETFDTWGLGVAIYFEVIRYRQQLHEGEFFPMSREKIKQLTGLSYWQQHRVKKILTVCDWIETIKKRDKRGGTINHFRVGAKAKEALEQVQRPQLNRLLKLKRNFALAR